METFSRHARLYTHKMQRGLIIVQNLQSNRSLLVCSEDIAHDITTIRFQLDLGIYAHPSLQQEYEQLGLELYRIEPYRLLDDFQDLESIQRAELQALKEQERPLY